MSTLLRRTNKITQQNLKTAIRDNFDEIFIDFCK